MIKVDTKAQIEEVFKIQNGELTISIKSTYGDAVEAGLKHDTFQIIATKRKVVANHNKACGPYGFRYFA